MLICTLGLCHPMVCYIDDESAHTRYIDDGNSCPQPAWSYGESLTNVSPVKHCHNSF